MSRSEAARRTLVRFRRPVPFPPVDTGQLSLTEASKYAKASCYLCGGAGHYRKKTATLGVVEHGRAPNVTKVQRYLPLVRKGPKYEYREFPFKVTVVTQTPLGQLLPVERTAVFRKREFVRGQGVLAEGAQEKVCVCALKRHAKATGAKP